MQTIDKTKSTPISNLILVFEFYSEPNSWHPNVRKNFFSEKPQNNNFRSALMNCVGYSIEKQEILRCIRCPKGILKLNGCYSSFVSFFSILKQIEMKFSSVEIFINDFIVKGIDC